MRTASLEAELTQVASAVYDPSTGECPTIGDLTIVPGETYVLKVTVPYLGKLIEYVASHISADATNYVVGLVINTMYSTARGITVTRSWVERDGIYVEFCARVDALELLSIGLTLAAVLKALAGIVALLGIWTLFLDSRAAINSELYLKRGAGGTPTTNDNTAGPGPDPSDPSQPAMDWWDWLAQRATSGKVKSAPKATDVAKGILVIAAAILAFQYAMSRKA